MGKQKQKGKEGTAVKYITRNQALNRLQLKLPEFRRLCILKGIHPREPNKKLHGKNKTYYHIKDIKFLMHEPLLQKGRELKVYEKKIKKARGKLEDALEERLRLNKPTYTLDHLVKERYPSFIDALRDLDDALTMINLFAVLPADPRNGIPVNHIHTARRLSLEWQAYVTKTHSLRKTFVSVKGIYYQAEVLGQKITWLVPHSLSQTIPSDVDFRVLFTFLEFYEVLLSFVNFKLYHDLHLKYPPILDPKLEELANELYAIVKGISQKQKETEEAIATEVTEMVDKETNIRNESENEKTSDEGKQDTIQKDNTANEENLFAESNARLTSLQERLLIMAKKSKKIKDGDTAMELSGNGDALDNHEKNNNKESAKTGEEEDDEEEESDEDGDRRLCRKLFKGLTFFLARETPREPLLFMIRCFGGVAGWQGEGSPFAENDDFITHQVVDRPSQKHRHLSREYVQPQWLFDCVNNRVLLPTVNYAPGVIPPPHLSPFVDNEVEGYVPEYAQVIERMKSEALGLSEDKKLLQMMPSKIDLDDKLLDMVANQNEDGSMAPLPLISQVVEQEKVYSEGLSKELAGKPYSASLINDADDSAAASDGGDGVADESRDVYQEEKERETQKKKKQLGSKKDDSTQQKAKVHDDDNNGDDETKLAQMMMPRKTKRLYEAMKLSNAKKKSSINLLEERKKAKTPKHA